MLVSLRQPVFLVSVTLIVSLVVLGASAPAAFESWATAALEWTTVNLGWFYLLSVFGFVCILVYLGFSKYAYIRLGDDDSQPQFSFVSWVSMLLAAGFGVGLVFYGVAEPMTHYLKPPYDAMIGGTKESARLAIQYTFFNWGVSQWAAFSIVGLIIGFYQFRRQEPGLVSTVLEPVTRRLSNSRMVGGALDVFAVVATVMGVATSLGLGVLQINGGLNHLAGLPENLLWQAIILGLLFAAFMTSAASGLDRGIKFLSNLNLALAVLLMAYVLVAGPTLAILRTIVQGLGDYLQSFIAMSLRAEPFGGSQWASEWTVFYWAWVIAWSPFVGTFVARISRGRTLREFVFGVLVMPSTIACLWMGVFGGAGLHLELTRGAGLATAVESSITTALFRLFDLLPLSQLLSVLGMALIFIFLVTSADSAAYIVAQMTDRGSTNPPLLKRLTWGILLAAICITLIATGGLRGLQAVAILAALPFTLILYAMVWALFRALAADREASLAALYQQHEIPIAASIEEARKLQR